MPSAAGKQALSVLRTFYPEALVVRREKIEAGLNACLRDQRVLLVPDVSRLPGTDWPALQSYQERGGALLFLGCDPFAERVTDVDGALTPEEDLHRAWMASARPVDDFSEVDVWAHRNNTGHLRGTVRFAKNPALPWKGIQIEVDGIDLWDVVESKSIPDHVVEGGEDSLAFYAVGDKVTTRLAVLAETRDGNEWQATIDVEPDWQPYVLHEAAFVPRQEGPPPEDSSLRLPDIKQLRIGLHNHYAPQAAGPHTFGISEVRMLEDSRPYPRVVDGPEGGFLGEPCSHYDLTAAQVECVLSGRKVRVGSARLQSPLVSFRGLGRRAGQGFRWAPVANAYTKDGESAGWPASIYVGAGQEGGVQVWGWIGLDLTESAREIGRALLSESILRLKRGWFFREAGYPTFFLVQGDPILVQATVVTGTDQVPKRVATELLDVNGYVLRRVVSDALPSAETAGHVVPVELNLGIAPRVQHDPIDYVVRVTIEDATGKGWAYDCIDQPIKVDRPRQRPGDDELLVASGSRFTLRHRPVFLSGLEYAPLVCTGPADRTHWLEPELFDPALVHRNLRRFADVGINAIGLSFTHPRQAPQLDYVIDEARRQGMWVYLAIEHLDPLNPDFAAARKLLAAGQLDKRSHVFALEISHQTDLGRYEERKRFDEAWQSWVTDQYGSPDHAEEILGALWRDGKRLTGPPDSELTADGSHRLAVVAYRRFIDDLLSRRYGEVRRFVRDLGYPQLLCARNGLGQGGFTDEGALPIDAASAAVHLDFILASARSWVGDGDRIREAGLITAYARGVSDGKPVVWVDSFTSVGTHPRRVDLQHQAARHEEMLEMVRRSAAAGYFGYAGVQNDSLCDRTERSVLARDGTWRPAGSVFQRFANRLRNEKRLPRVWQGREVNRFADSRGARALWDNWRAVYREEVREDRMEEVRPFGFAKQSREVPLVTVGGAAHSDPAPLQALNAEWGRMLVDGKRYVHSADELRVQPRQKLSLELINTGAATWSASREGSEGTMWVEVHRDGSRPRYMKVNSVAFGESITVTWVPPDLGRWTLRAYLWGAGGVGETLRVNVRPVRPHMSATL